MYRTYTWELLFLQLKFPYLLTNRNLNYIVFSSCLVSVKHYISGECVALKLRYRQKGTLFPKCSALHYWSTGNKKLVFARAWKLQGTNFQENQSQGSLEEMVLCSPSQCPLSLTDRKQTHTICSLCVEVCGTKFLENPLELIRDTDAEVHRSSSNASFIIHQSRPNLTNVVDRGGRLPYMDFQENPLKGRIDRSKKVHFLFK